MHFFRTLKVPIKLVLKTLSGSFFETSIAGSAQQSIIIKRQTFLKLIHFFNIKIIIFNFIIFEPISI